MASVNTKNSRKYTIIRFLSFTFMGVLLVEAILLFKENTSTHYYIFMVILELLALLTLSFYPRTGCCFVAGTWFLSTYATPILPSTFVFALFFSLILISYLNRNISIILITALIIGNFICQEKPEDLIPLLGIFSACYAIGFSLQVHEKNRKHELTISQLQLNKAYASELHDNICNKLSCLYIRISNDPLLQESTSYKYYLNEISSILDQTREVVIALESGNNIQQKRPETLISELNHDQSILTKHGYKIITFTPSIELAANRNDLIIIHILREFTSNIIKYADPHSPIYLSVSASTKNTTISLTNAKRNIVIPQSNHTGLSRIEEEIKTMHGTMEISQSDTTWSALIILPNNQ